MAIIVTRTSSTGADGVVLLSISVFGDPGGDHVLVVSEGDAVEHLAVRGIAGDAIAGYALLRRGLEVIRRAGVVQEAPEAVDVIGILEQRLDAADRLRLEEAGAHAALLADLREQIAKMTNVPPEPLKE